MDRVIRLSSEGLEKWPSTDSTHDSDVKVAVQEGNRPALHFCYFRT